MLANPDTSLLISGFSDDTGGGLFCFDGDKLDQLDDLSTTGLNAFDGHLARLLRTGTDEEAPGATSSGRPSFKRGSHGSMSSTAQAALCIEAG